MNPVELTYLGNVNANLICCICCMPFTNPTATTTCTHTFCKDCIIAALAFNSECPVDRSELTHENLVPASTIIRNLVDELTVQCPNSIYGCEHTTQRQLLNNHLSNECLYVSTNCQEEDCQALLLRGQVDQHSANCPHRIVPCEACSAPVKYKDLEYHGALCPAAEVLCVHCSTIMSRSEYKEHLASCPEVTIPCGQSANGCPWTGPRRNIDAHTSTCPYESIKGFFAINNSRISELESSNHTLREQLARLEASYSSVRRDLDNVRHSLGPWYRHPNEALVPVQAPPPMERRPRASLSIPLTPSSFPRDATESDLGTAEPHDYFSVPSTSGSLPASSSISPQPSLPASRDPVASLQSHSHSSSLSGIGSFTAEDFTLRALPMSMPAYPQHQSRVAPLDLSTSLEGCLNSLRTSMVTISSGLDSLERRQDLALTTETLRMHEDVASLRAIVHGLRMQVHSMMMDRNWLASGRPGGAELAGGAGAGGPSNSHAYGPPGEMTPASVEHDGIVQARPYFPSHLPIHVSQMTSMRRTSGMENKL